MSDKLTDEEFDRLKQQCQDSGHVLDPAKPLAEDYGDEIVVVGDKIMPAWMAAMFGSMPPRKPEDNDAT